MIDLFSGIGGFSLAGHWVGWKTVQFCEKNVWCGKVLKKNFPGVPIHRKIETLTREIIINNNVWNPNDPTIIVGGFPCQPFSVSGKRSGTEDERYLWPDMLRVIREVAPRWVVGENVYGILNWGDGLVFDSVCADLENEGYEVQPYILPACGVNAPHQRKRVWFVAYANGAAPQRGFFTNQNKSRKLDCEVGDFWSKWPTESPVCVRNDGFSPPLVQSARQIVKAAGNAIVPQVAERIFMAINHFENNLNL